MAEKEDYSKILEEDYQKKIELIKDKTNILHFSTGADSIAVFLRLREAGIEPILIYKYFVPNLPMVNNYLDYFSKKFNVRIYQFPNSLMPEMFGNVQHQRPTKRDNYFYEQIKWVKNITKEAFDKFLEGIFTDKKNTVYHYGLRYTDGLHRFLHLKKNGVYFQNKFYAIASYKVGDIQNILRKYDCKLPIEYGLWGISFESPRAWNIGLIKEHCPETHKIIKDWFPLIDYKGYREKFNKLNRHFKTRLKQYSEFAIDKKEYQVW